MAEESKIEWTNATFNPWIGCQKISAGCQHCYAEALMDTRYGKVQWGPTGERKRTSDSYWRQPYKWNREAQAQGIRRKVFCGSLCDVFEDRPEVRPWRDELWELIEVTPHLDWLLLTKRPQNIDNMLPWRWTIGGAIPTNVWLGTSVEDQKAANERIPALIQIPAAVRFLSCEPLLGPIDLGRAIPCGYYCDQLVGHVDHPFWSQVASPIHWVICGGESGPHARPFHIEWAIDLMAQCDEAGVAFFFKQMGDHCIDRHGERIQGLGPKGHDWSLWPPELRVREFPTD